MKKIIDKKIKKNIIFTIAYYNVSNYFPSRFFVWRNLISINNGLKCDLLFVEKEIDWLIRKGILLEKEGLLLINSEIKNQAMVDRKYKGYIQKNKISSKKIKEARAWAKKIVWIPYLREMFLTGTLMMKKSSWNSDWDVLTVLRQNRIWLGRLFVSGWLHFFSKRRYGKKIKDRFCLNQFIVDKQLLFLERNEFIANELLLSIPLFSDNNLKDEIMKKNAFWIKKIKPNFKYYFNLNNIQKYKLLKTFRITLENLLGFFGIAEVLNKYLKRIMIRRILNNSKTYLEQADIRYSDFYLVFLPYPQRNKLEQKAFVLLTKI